MIALIPARGGSRGLIGKNIKNFNGIPLVGLAVLDCINAENIEEVYISTDDKKIEEIAISFGAKSLGLRPSHLASDGSLVNDTFRYMIDIISSDKNKSIEELMIAQPTSPLRIPEDIDNSINMYFNNQADSVISFTHQPNPISWFKAIDSNNRILSTSGHSSFSNRQDEPMLFVPNGAVYVLSKNIIFSNSWYSKKTYAYIMPKERSIDIDDNYDFEFATHMSRKLGIKNSSNNTLNDI